MNVAAASYNICIFLFVALVTFIMSVMSSVHRRKSYTLLFKLQVIKWYHQNGENAHATASHFHIDRSVIRRWLINELVLKKAKKRSIKGVCRIINLCIRNWMMHYLNTCVMSELHGDQSAISS